MNSFKSINKVYIIPAIFSLLFIVGSNYKTTLIGDEFEYVSIAKSIAGGEGIKLFGLPTTITFTWSALISLFFSGNLNVHTSILLCRILSLILIIITMFEFTYILGKLKIDNRNLSEDKIFIIQIFTFGNFYFWNIAGSMYTGPLAISVLFFICTLLVKEKVNVGSLILLGLFSSVLVSTKYVTVILYPALMFHFIVKYGFSKKTVLNLSIIFLVSFILLFPVIYRFINLEFFSHAKYKFSYLQDYNEQLEDSTPFMALFNQVGTGFYIFASKFHEYFTTISKLDAFYFSVIFFAPVFIFFYKNIKTKFTFSFFCMFTIFYMLALVVSGYGGNTRYWILVFPFLILFFIEGLSGLNFFKKEMIFENAKLHKASKLFVYLMAAVFIILFLKFRFSEIDSAKAKNFTLLLSFTLASALLIFYLLNEKKIYRWKLAALVFLILPFSRGLNEYLLLQRPFPNSTGDVNKAQTELCEFIDKTNYDYPIFQKTDVLNASWTTAYSNKKIFDLETDYDMENLSRIYLIKRIQIDYENIVVSGNVYRVINEKTIFSNQLYKIEELELSKIE